ncbi:MAG: phage Gp37/Gp68 family protein [Mycobacterium sp.]|nr:MAG: phage Gp37/Gp68 family protein [Mycobacterium sp.]
MSATTSIEWTEATWNPVTGCTEVSPGCDHCYAKVIAERFRGGPAFPNGFDVQLRPDKLDLPLRWRRPRRIFVNSMSDLFHDDVPDEYIAQVWAVMALAPRHTFQVLTKRHGRMRSLVGSGHFAGLVYKAVNAILAQGNPPRLGDDTIVAALDGFARGQFTVLPNVWGMVTAENQQWADIRIPALLDAPFAVRGVSLEPLLGPITLSQNWLVAEERGAVFPADVRVLLKHHGVPMLDWVVVGGESGHGARPMHPDWARSLRDQCTAAGVPFLFKQWGEWAPAPWYGPDGATHAFTGGLYQDDAGRWVENFMAIGHNPMSGERDRETPPGAQGMRRVGKKAAGRQLDGQTWDQYPEAVS